MLWFKAVSFKVNLNFRMFLLPNNADAIRGYMGRFLRRRILEREFSENYEGSPQIFRIVGFLSEVLAATNSVSYQWYGKSFETTLIISALKAAEYIKTASLAIFSLINFWAMFQFIEKVHSRDMTIGPRIFLQCPLDVIHARRWFIQLWNEMIVPYMIKVTTEGKFNVQYLLSPIQPDS